MAWKSHLGQRASQRQAVVMYHGVPRDGVSGLIHGKSFEEQIQLLKSHFDIISIEDLLARKQPRDGRIQVLITFDDGYQNNYSVAAPILEKHKVPAVFFTCKRHTARGKYLFYDHFRVLHEHYTEGGFFCRGRFRSMEPGARENTLTLLSEELTQMEPYPRAMYEVIESEFPQLESFVDSDELAGRYAGMEDRQIKEIAGNELFTLGVHTLDHPSLTRCSDSESFRQLCECKTWLERITDRPCRTVAYPFGEYNARTLSQVRELGFAAGFAVCPHGYGDPSFEMSRIGLYRADLDYLGVKVVFGRHIPSWG
jgi:peptidoglycan/xylan/chitin deacetylase (PgdA/CDA1 family)